MARRYRSPDINRKRDHKPIIGVKAGPLSSPPPNPLNVLPRRIPRHPNGSKPRLCLRLLLK